MLTMDHVFDSFCVILCQVDDTSRRLLKATATCSLEECRASCQEYAMYLISFASTDNGQIGILATLKQSERLS
jgi:hypothetical protein